ncbi:lysozyme inhibitor LprI family protein [Azohydromonas aeria]|uniref:lysozyme inhibitor LprI family protein n=1 Tax=Azohydromonas aeria TaxID=2590212 RepID=UPI0012F79394|nr:lysozyme inhibitor LprI family protein [Azohydromonas aeria]
MKHGLLVLALLCAAGPACARDAGLSPEFSACMDQSNGVTATMLACMSAETRRQDARLNQAYKAVMAQLSEARQKELRDAQRAWLKFREANCRFYADPEGGTIATVNASDCLMSATAARARELEGFKR